ncbi:glycosyltransferase [Mesobacterium pallidum]|uniref:glycosyltransferase n=1 Tax=Mesobacterium pallidum TaxID=2872037 RepID=UPI001EE1D04D|nr:glycosyltransferase [Mesobacterium pallidum]
MKVLVLADECNPEWPSLPIVGYKYARELAQLVDVTLVTHVRNRENIEKTDHGLDVVYLDTEWIAGPMFRLARLLRGGEEVAWSTSMIMNYLPYLAFERAAWKRFRRAIRDGEFDIVHRITPMSPTLPSYISVKSPVPFVIGPLNGNLPWPAAFAAEQKREKEGLRRLRDLYKVLPYAGPTQRRASAVLYGFEHTRKDLGAVQPGRLVSFPEIGYDPAIFHARGRKAAGEGPMEFLYAGRLVPYKLPELVLHVFAGSPELRRHRLRILGDGPERARMEAVIAEHGLQDCVAMEGRKSQAEVAEAMRSADVFVFPSIRELGAGVVIEAMACGAHCAVVDYGAPGALAGAGRGSCVPLGPFDALVQGFRAALERCAADRVATAEAAAAGRAYAEAGFPWAKKGARTLAIYKALTSGRSLEGLGYD